MRLETKARGRLRRGPLVLAILDGVGEGPKDDGDAVFLAKTPTLARLRLGPWRLLKAHGTAVGMPSDGDMGNSEIGHNAIGAGRVFAQGAKLVNEALESGSIWQGQAWKDVIGGAKATGGTLHFLGLLSDGNVHSHEAHLRALLERAASEGQKRLRLHLLLDGRDVAPDSALLFIDRVEEVLQGLEARYGCDAKIASGGGRMVITMDRYEADWEMVEKGWKTHIEAEGRGFPTARKAIEVYRKEGCTNDQFLPPFVICKESEGGESSAQGQEGEGRGIGPICDGDSVILFNFRGDRAIEISRAFEEESLTKIQRKKRPKVCFAGMMLYDGDLQIPKRYLVSPPAIDRTISEYLVHAKIRQYAVSETQKYGHVTYFWNGNRSGMFSPHLETYKEIPSDRVPFEQRPWMKAAEITDAAIEALRSGKHDFVRINYPNGDMVGHTGSIQASILAVESVDLCLERLLRVVEEVGGIALITADHGNADEMVEHDGKGKIKRDKEGGMIPKTSHSLSPVPFFVMDPGFQGEYRLSGKAEAGISSIAATIVELLGFEPPSDYDRSLLSWEESERDGGSRG